MADTEPDPRAAMALHFIEETLDELAQMALKHGYRGLAATLTLAAHEAKAAAGAPPDPTH